MKRRPPLTISVRDRVRGLLLGFAIGDALGAPAAGIPGDSFCRRFGRICGFTTNPLHPYLGRLQPGQYTENTRLLLDSVRDYSKWGSFCGRARQETLRNWAERIENDPGHARWPGPTTLRASQALIEGPPNPGLGDSISATYRCLPIAVLVYTKSLISEVSSEVKLTHAHSDSIISAGIITELARDVLFGYAIRKSIERSLEAAAEQLGASSLIQKCFTAIADRSELSALCTTYGTGARCIESLPMVCGILARSASSPRSRLLDAANAFKPGDGDDWDVMASGNGGNTDGIAAIVGSILGAHYGESKLLSLSGQVEAADGIRSLADVLSTRFGTV